MESTTINDEIKEVRELFNELRSNISHEQKRELDVIFIKKKLFIIF